MKNARPSCLMRIALTALFGPGLSLAGCSSDGDDGQLGSGGGAGSGGAAGTGGENGTGGAAGVGGNGTGGVAGMGQIVDTNALSASRSTRHNEVVPRNSALSLSPMG